MFPLSPLILNPVDVCTGTPTPFRGGATNNSEVPVPVRGTDISRVPVRGMVDAVNGMGEVPIDLDCGKTFADNSAVATPVVGFVDGVALLARFRFLTCWFGGDDISFVGMDDKPISGVNTIAGDMKDFTSKTCVYCVKNQRGSVARECTF